MQLKAVLSPKNKQQLIIYEYTTTSFPQHLRKRSISKSVVTATLAGI